MNELPRAILNLLMPGTLAGAGSGVAIGLQEPKGFPMYLMIGLTSGLLFGFVLTVPHTLLMEVAHRRGLPSTGLRTLAVYAASGATHGAIAGFVSALAMDAMFRQAVTTAAILGAIGAGAGFVTGYCIGLIAKKEAPRS